jgi:carbon storage regulator CsrA
MSIPFKCEPGDNPGKRVNHNPDSSTKIISDNQYTVSLSAEPPLSCEMQNGIPVIQGGISGYYLFNKDCHRLLILTSKPNESIVVDNTIDIVVLEINGDQVKLGIICPENTIIRCNDSYDDGNNDGTTPKPR